MPGDELGGLGESGVPKSVDHGDSLTAVIDFGVVFDIKPKILAIRSDQHGPKNLGAVPHLESQCA